MPHGAILTAKKRKLLIVCAMHTKTVRAVCLKDRLPPTSFYPRLAWQFPACSCLLMAMPKLDLQTMRWRPCWPGQPMQAWLDKLWHAWSDMNAMTFPACPGDSGCADSPGLISP